MQETFTARIGKYAIEDGKVTSPSGKTVTVLDGVIEQLSKKGANLWEGGKHKRLYLNDVATELIGINVERYNTGNVRYATLDGEKISNNYAKEILRDMNGMYVDVANPNNITVKGGQRYLRERVMRTLAELLK